MKKILLILSILGFIQIYCIAGNPDNPPYVLHDGIQSISPGTTEVGNNCLALLSVVDVTVHLTVTDCPDYECEAKDSCSFHINLYSNYNYIGNFDFNPKVCSYEGDFRASEGYPVIAIFVADNPPGCNQPFNNIPSQSAIVPQGGGDMYISIKFCE